MQSAAEIKNAITILDTAMKDTDKFIRSEKDNTNITPSTANTALHMIDSLNTYLKIINNNMYSITERIAILESIVESKEDLIKNLKSLHPLIYPLENK